MPAVLETPPDARIDRQLAQAAGRIKATDILTGLLAIVAFTLFYAAAMILLDRTFQFAGWVRQAGFLGWLGIVGYTAYRFIIRPFGQRVNPLFVAKKVVEFTAVDLDRIPGEPARSNHEQCLPGGALLPSLGADRVPVDRDGRRDGQW